MNTLFSIFNRHSDGGFFLEDNAEWTETEESYKNLIPISAIASNFFKEQGKGILVMHFENIKACESLAISLSLMLQPLPMRQPPPLPKLTYETWPIRRKQSSNLLHHILPCLNLDELMQEIDHQHTFALCIHIPPTLPGDGGTQACTLMYDASALRDVPLTSAMAPIHAKTDLTGQLRHRLMHDEAFAECRRIIAQFRNGPGRFWLRNVFDNSDTYDTKQIKKLTPKKLLTALQDSWRQQQNNSQPLRLCYKQLAAVYTPITDMQWHQECKYLQEGLVEVLKQHAEMINDPTTVIGFFITTVGGKGSSADSNDVLTTFTVPRKAAPSDYRNEVKEEFGNDGNVSIDCSNFV